jgi:hypothetical protein
MWVRGCVTANNITLKYPWGYSGLRNFGIAGLGFREIHSFHQDCVDPVTERAGALPAHNPVVFTVLVFHTGLKISMFHLRRQVAGFVAGSTQSQLVPDQHACFIVRYLHYSGV